MAWIGGFHILDLKLARRGDWASFASQRHCRRRSFGITAFDMSRAIPHPSRLPHRSAPLRRELPGLAVTLLPALPYEVNYVADHHVIGFTFEPQEGVHAFGSARRRPFHADPWRLALTPAGCDVFSASASGGEYLLITVVPEVLAHLAPETERGRLAQFTNLADPWFTSLAAALRRAVCSGPTVDDFELDVLITRAVARTMTHLGGEPAVAGLARAMTVRRMSRVLDYMDAHFDEEVRLAELARQVGLSGAYLARAFRAATGTTLHAALIDRRLARARRLIRDANGNRTGGNLAAIAAAAGFSSHAHMVATFQRVLGTTPTGWARMAARGAEDA